MEYYEISSLSNIYLEDSYVLEIEEKNDSLIFTLDAVLTEKNPQYSPPKEGEQYCYKKALLCFENVTWITWIRKNYKKYTDKNDEVDYGNIDSFKLDAGVYALSGDWGDVKLECNKMEFKLK